MDLNDLHPPDDYSHRFFIWHEWIQANGPLTAENVFDYFATSMFYDKQSNNQVLRMQTIHIGIPIANEAEELRRFTGIEFALVHAQPPTFFIIHKRERLSPDEVRPLAAYFIIHNRIYQSPNVYSVLSNRLLTAVHSLQASLDVLRKHRPDYTPRTGFVWPITDPSTDDASKARKQDADSTEQDSLDMTEPEKRLNAKREQNNFLLSNAIRMTAAHSRLSFNTIPTDPADAGTSISAETPAPTQGIRSSTTPGPGTQEATIKGSAGPAPIGAGSQPQDQQVKGPAGGGKKKKKRTSVAVPTAPA